MIFPKGVKHIAWYIGARTHWSNWGKGEKKNIVHDFRLVFYDQITLAVGYYQFYICKAVTTTMVLHYIYIY